MHGWTTSTHGGSLKFPDFLIQDLLFLCGGVASWRGFRVLAIRRVLCQVVQQKQRRNPVCCLRDEKWKYHLWQLSNLIWSKYITTKSSVKGWNCCWDKFKTTSVDHGRILRGGAHLPWDRFAPPLGIFAPPLGIFPPPLGTFAPPLGIFPPSLKSNALPLAKFQW
jgi:hypothetical protein